MPENRGPFILSEAGMNVALNALQEGSITPRTGAAPESEIRVDETETVDLSIVVPLLDEEGNVGPLVSAVREAMSTGGKTDSGPDSRGGSGRWELILVNDGSRDGTGAAIDREARADPRIRPIHLARRYGQTAAMRAGFECARASVFVSLDGDLQNDPADIPRLVETLKGGYDLVVGYRVDRKDPLLTRRLPSRVANSLVSWLTGIRIRDSGCSLKAYRREVMERLTLYSDMHRFIPALAASLAGARIAEIPVRHHPRVMGASKYGLRRVLQVLADLIAVKTIRSFRERPLVLFGAAAMIAGVAAVGFGVLAAIAYLTFRPDQAYALVLPGISGTFAGFAAYLLLLGLVAEVAVERWSRAHGALLPLSTGS